MARLYPVEGESAIAELYYDDMIWAYVSLEGVDAQATGQARVKDASVVVEFWREPKKPTGQWDFNLDLAGALEQLEKARDWLLENEVGRAPAEPGLSAAGEAFQKMSEEEQERWSDRSSEEVLWTKST